MHGRQDIQGTGKLEFMPIRRSISFVTILFQLVALYIRGKELSDDRHSCAGSAERECALLIRTDVKSQVARSVERNLQSLAFHVSHLTVKPESRICKQSKWKLCQSTIAHLQTAYENAPAKRLTLKRTNKQGKRCKQDILYTLTENKNKMENAIMAMMFSIRRKVI